MRFKFLDWYTQALGATLGVIACIYAYLNGYMFVYSNIENNFDFLGFSGVISSYLLLPLCILTLIFSLIKSYTLKKEIFNIPFESFNIFISVLTIIIGFMGAKIYFLIPGVFIVFNIISPSLHNNESENQETLVENHCEDAIKNTVQFNLEKDVLTEADESIDNNNKILDTKYEMAIELLNKNSDKQFITEITGLTLEEINMLEKDKE